MRGSMAWREEPASTSTATCCAAAGAVGRSPTPTQTSPSVRTGRRTAHLRERPEEGYRSPSTAPVSRLTKRSPRPTVDGRQWAGSLPQQLEGVTPLAAQHPRDAPEHAQRLDRARRLDPAHVGRL